ncbi:HEPN domain-containing protein [Pseudomonas sp. Irchel 3A5]|uniref:HEPN domain-containing protein n=1 Tax=Pseudomonas sp. Irchel 3A5 TaxID=2008911 RepID=UPI000BA2C7B3|nr:HEPN domain-containing protein [Pseudomonas sp. Irchel 3A5]
MIKKTDPEAFNRGVSDFLKTNTGKDLSKQTLLTVIRSSHVFCKSSDDSNITEKLLKFIDLFEACKVKAHSTLKTLHGADSTGLLEPKIIGPITIYAIPRHADQIESLFESCKHKFREGTDRVIVEHRSMVRDQIKALELANTAFNTLDLLIAFLLGDRNKTHAAGVMHLRFDPFQRAIITSVNGFFGGEEEFLGFRESVDINHLLSPDLCQGTDVSSGLISNVVDPLDEIGRKISRAVEWVGEAYIEKNKASAFLKAAVAMEVLLKVDEKGVISSSIVSTMAEQCAFLLGRDADDCFEIEGKVKAMYGVRSSIVHSGSSSVDDSLLQEFLDLIRQIIFKVVELKISLNLKHMKELQATLKKRKYRGNG